MTAYLLVFAGALVLSIALTPLARYLAPHLGVIDHPSARKVHRTPVPRLGGVAIYLAVLAAALALGERYNFAQFGSVIIGATAVSFMGLVDDRWGLRPAVKLVGQILAALLLWATGVRVGTFGQPVVDFMLTVFWVVYITNAI
ncbi:MAG: undecaprenyl/decaprenyl-phosphate alpha-N-acetylglucosaminyl 1-phosphate transferase, partial [Chloroflexi bacterium]|nr:undecaprenyl/decaprenyl-phosphate alpha-N-acetylglucosaminyl 1-phosphate transferase [Chloroflexota bacterium]